MARKRCGQTGGLRRTTAHLIEIARAVPVATHVKEYAVRLLLATHPDQEDAPEKVRKFVRYGASPRGLQALIMTAKVRALLEGRYNVSLEDLQAVAFPALRHRIILNFDGLADGITPEELIDDHHRGNKIGISSMTRLRTPYCAFHLRPAYCNGWTTWR